MPELKTIILPERDDMLRRLLEVEDNPHAQQKFYPILLQSAGQQRNGMGVIMMLQMAIHDYTVGMPSVIAVAMQMLVKPYVEALVDDEEVKADAFKMIDEISAEVAANREQ